MRNGSHSSSAWPASKMIPKWAVRAGTPTQKRVAKRQHIKKCRQYYEREMRLSQVEIETDTEETE